MIQIRFEVIGKMEHIKKLPFYSFWEKKSFGSTIVLVGKDDKLIYLNDWEKFSRRFINTGT